MVVVIQAAIGIQAGSLSPKAPTAGQKDVAINAQIVIQGTSAVSLGTDSCFLNGEYITPTAVASNLAIFRPGELLYGTTYTLEIRTGAFTDKSGNPMTGCTFSFTTVSPETRVFDAIVAADGSGDYKSIRAAIKAAPTNRTEPWLIFVKNGVYTELVRVAENQPHISLIGEDPDKTILKFSITSNGGHERDNANFSEAEGMGPVLAVKGSDFYLHNISVIDSWGYDNQAGPQALAFGSYADRITLFNSKLYSYQDTWQTGSDEHRAYARNCYVEGAVDFIYCSGNLVMDSCTIGFCRNGSVLTAPSHGAGVKYGYVFRNCNVVSSKPGTARTGNVWGRPWHNSPRTCMINTTLSKDITLTPAGWIDHMGGLPAVFAEYNTMNYKGEPLDLSQRISRYYKETDGVKTYATAKNILTKEEADFLTARNVLSGEDQWRPENIVTQLPAPKVSYEGQRLSWNLEPQAICYEILRNGSFLCFTTDTFFEFEGNASEYRVRAVNHYGTPGKESKVPFVNDIQPKTAADLDVVCCDDRMTVYGFSGEAAVDVFTLCGINVGGFRMESGSSVELSEKGLLMVRIAADGGVWTRRIFVK